MSPDQNHQNLRSLAILIGVSRYADREGFPPVNAADNSVNGMKEILESPLLCGWRGGIELIRNPASPTDLSLKIAELAERTTGVLLIYYAGHGRLSDQGQLCLTVSTTRATQPAITGVPWEHVASALRTSPARVRIAILDCCFAGQAIEALAGEAEATVADVTHVEGVYTLTATTRNRTAHVPPPWQQTTACTSFTAELIHLVRTGLPNDSAVITLGDIYPVLRNRLAARGLPLPNQRGTDLADRFVLAHNAWRQQPGALGGAGEPITGHTHTVRECTTPAMPTWMPYGTPAGKTPSSGRGLRVLLMAATTLVWLWGILYLFFLIGTYAVGTDPNASTGSLVGANVVMGGIEALLVWGMVKLRRMWVRRVISPGPTRDNLTAPPTAYHS
ncbi:caspase family protein [Streptomyces sp. UNOC14_S4]|uniref:caspase family protein n=1 Tax=Streptomyces sp. UNOC14_S4 TaxID=2872340 RepID=UPI001E518703|nr:caspase family protein [Streptomyces sp. UNOC14_S4]MCC3767598.1 caspase family protein [Streptomyces sp. UNOC14_S4]